MFQARGAAAIVLASVLLCAAGPAHAILVTNGSFETGDTTGWSTVGQVSVVTSSFGVTPTHGSYQILLGTGGSSVSRSATETAMGLSNKTIEKIFKTHLGNTGLSSSSTGPTQGSAIQISFSATAGEALEFDWDFLTDERVSSSPNRTTPNPGLYTDFVWMHLDAPTGPDITAAPGHANQPASAFSASSTAFAHETGYGTHTVALNRTGTYTLTLGVHDVEDSFVDSAVVFDWIYIRQSPEPDTFAMLGLGLLGLAIYGRRGGRSSAIRPKSSTTSVRASSPRSSR